MEDVQQNSSRGSRRGMGICRGWHHVVVMQTAVGCHGTKVHSTDDEGAERTVQSSGSILGVLLYRMCRQKHEKVTDKKKSFARCNHEI